MKIDEKKKPIVKTISIVVIMVSLSTIFLNQCHFQPRMNLRPYQGLGYGMAIETSKLLNKKGQIAVIYLDGSELNIKPFKVQMATFFTTLKEESNITVAYEEKISPKSLPRGLGSNIDSKLYFKILEQHPNLSAIVSFLGPPQLTDEDWSKIPQEIPKMIIYSVTAHGLKKLFNEQIVQIAIVNNSLRIEGTTHKKLPDIFDYYYKVVTEKELTD